MLNQKSVLYRFSSRDVRITILFGLLSATLGLIQLETPGFEGSYSDLREIALLCSLFHIANPLFIIPLCLLTLLGITFEIKLIAVFFTHAIPLFITWHLYQRIRMKKMSSVKIGIAWNIVAMGYYMVLLYPLLIVTYNWVGINTNVNFISSYRSLFASGVFEMIATALISSMYLIQLNIRRSLEDTNKNLEEIVKKRTQELTLANNDLQILNDNLEELVEERTQKINTQLVQISKYVHMNSHEVRAPLARILGLMGLIKQEADEKERKALLDKLDASSIELDDVVKGMNRLLEQEATND